MAARAGAGAFAPIAPTRLAGARELRLAHPDGHVFRVSAPLGQP